MILEGSFTEKASGTRGAGTNDPSLWHFHLGPDLCVEGKDSVRIDVHFPGQLYVTSVLANEASWSLSLCCHEDAHGTGLSSDPPLKV